MTLTIRAADATDVDAILALWRDSAENRSRPADTREAIDVLLKRDPDALLIAVDDTTAGLLGTVIVGWDGWRSHLYRLAVHPDHRRKGVGHALVAATEDRARALGATRMDAMVLDDNDLGQAIWLARGYTRQDDWRRWVKPLG
jgi:ribosomal protein S18 acetylase RimI-like enzyme